MVIMKNLSIVVIPSYQPKKEFIDYTKELSMKVDRIIVVNDGSGQEYDSIFDEINSVEKAVVLSYKSNQGKGYALKQGFLYATENFSEHDIIVTCDADGQHKIDDVLSVLSEAIINPQALILGSRDFSLSNVPKKSRLGNLTMRKMFKFFYGGNVYDTQTGLRAFSVKIAYEFLNVKGNRFEYELAQLIYAQKSRIQIIERKIQTVYAENPSEHKTHFRAGKDSLMVLKVMLKNVSAYFLSTILSGVIDLGLFWLLSMVVFPFYSPFYSFLAVAIARVSSSFVNYLINFKFVFKGAGKRSAVKYYFLWAGILSLSYLNVLVFGNLLNNNLVVVKVIGDLILGVVSYELQSNWVFKRKLKGDFYGVIASFSKSVYKFFTKNFKCNVKKGVEPTIYVCRHLNMSGPITVIKSLDFDVHPMALKLFFDRRDSYSHLKDFTFSKKLGKRAKKFSLKAKISAWYIEKLVFSLKAVPVFRGDNKSLITLKKSLEYLEKGESLIVFPDVDYKSDYSTVSDIYEGFLFLTEMYRRKTGKTLIITPLFIDYKSKEIVKRNEIIIADYKEEKERAKLKLIEEINVKNSENTSVEMLEAVNGNL